MKKNNPKKQFAVIGDPISHSLSPAMHNAAYLHLNIDAKYSAIHVKTEALENFIDTFRADDRFIGFNITVPHKETIIPFLDGISDEAKHIGAVNTVVKVNGKVLGYNTDGRGYILSLSEELGLDVAGKDVVILGAGGSARSIAVSILNANAASLIIMNRTQDKALKLKAELSDSRVSVKAFTELDSLRNAALIINTTSVGMSATNNACPLPDMSWVHSGQVLSDIIYAPLETYFLKAAKRNGAKTINGLGMLAGQGAIAFALFTQAPISYTFMLNQLKESL